MPRRRSDDFDFEDDYDPRPRRRGGEETDTFGIIGLILGIIAVVCLLLGCFTCGLTYFVAAPLALIGGICSFFGRGGMKVAGLVLNVLTLIPGVIVFGMMVTGAGMNIINPRQPPAQQQNQKPEQTPEPKQKVKQNPK